MKLKDLDVEVFPNSAEVLAEAGDEGKLNAGGKVCLVQFIIRYVKPH